MPDSVANPDSKYFVGVDLGGTKILSGVYNQRLEFIGKMKLSTKSQRGPEAVIQRIARCIKEAVDECDISFDQVAGVGIGAPGTVHPEDGKVAFAPNLNWENIPLRKTLEKELKVPVFLENDCNICTLGVYHADLKEKPDNVVGIFIGTGIGAGLIINRRLYAGFNHTAGEIGHMVIEVGGEKCNCGNRGCFEAVAGRAALFRKIQNAVKSGEKTILTEMLGNDLNDMRSGDLKKAIKKGDKLVEQFIEESAEYVGIGVANLMNLINPEVIVLGGGIMDALEDEMLSIIVETARDYAMPGTSKGVEIIATKIGDDAGICGGAVLVKQMTESD